MFGDPQKYTNKLSPYQEIYSINNTYLYYSTHPLSLITLGLKTGCSVSYKQPSVKFDVTKLLKFGNKDEDSTKTPPPSLSIFSCMNYSFSPTSLVRNKIPSSSKNGQPSS